MPTVTFRVLFVFVGNLWFEVGGSGGFSFIAIFKFSDERKVPVEGTGAPMGVLRDHAPHVSWREARRVAGQALRPARIAQKIGRQGPGVRAESRR